MFSMRRIWIKKMIQKVENMRHKSQTIAKKYGLSLLLHYQVWNTSRRSGGNLPKIRGNSPEDPGKIKTEKYGRKIYCSFRNVCGTRWKILQSCKELISRGNSARKHAFSFRKVVRYSRRNVQSHLRVIWRYKL